MRISTTALATAGLAAMLTACGGDKTFDESGMTFTYPGSFNAGRSVGAKPSGRVIGIVGLGPEDYIAARGQRTSPLPLTALKANLPDVLAGVIPSSVHLERHGKLTMVAARQKPPGTTDVEAQVYFFNGSGRTWQLECRSEPRGRARIRAGCAQALRTVKVG